MSLYACIFSRYCIFFPKLSFEASLLGRQITLWINYPSWFEFETDKICEFHIRRIDHGFVLSRGNNSTTLNMAAMAYLIISTKRKREFKDNLILETVWAKTFCLMLQWCAAGGNRKQPAEEEKNFGERRRKKPFYHNRKMHQIFFPRNASDVSSFKAFQDEINWVYPSWCEFKMNYLS